MGVEPPNSGRVDAVKPGGKRGLARIVAATGYSIKGLRACFRYEEAFRQELVVCVVLTISALFLSRSFAEGVMLILPLVIVLVVELVNSAIEAVVDRIGPEHHDLSGRAKDIGSAAVFVSVWTAGLIWVAFLIVRLS